METKGAGIDSLGFAIEGPSQAEIHCQERTPGICDVRYYPTTPGNYAIHVTCGDEDIPKSPFMVPISPAGDAKKVYAEGPGLQPEGVVAGKALFGQPRFQSVMRTVFYYTLWLYVRHPINVLNKPN